MVIARDRQLAIDLTERLARYEIAQGPLPGLVGLSREPLIRQFVDSVRRDRYFELLMGRELSQSARDPEDVERFDPIRGAILAREAGDTEEALWLVFIATHFGKHRPSGWEYARRVYGALGTAPRWTWSQVTETPEEFRDWLDAHRAELEAKPGGFSNHRKFESMAGRTANGTGAVVASYLDWAGSPPSQGARLEEVAAIGAGDPVRTFDLLYRSLGAVTRFGRLARFDYLNHLRRLGFLDIVAGKVYFQGASGPMSGAIMLWGGAPSAPAAAWYEARAASLASYLGVGFDVIEDGLCNWQKSPTVFKRFSG